MLTKLARTLALSFLAATAAFILVNVIFYMGYYVGLTRACPSTHIERLR